MTRKLALAAAALAAVLAVASMHDAGAAGTGTVNFQAKAQVNAKCTIGKSGDLDFGTYDPLSATDQQGQTNLNITCTRNSPASVSITVGSNYNSALGGTFLANRRSMKRAGQAGAPVAGDLLAYDLFQPSGTVAGGGTKTSTLWGDGTSITTVLAVASASSKLSESFTVFGTIPAGQDVTPDSFADNVTATISF